MLRPALIALLLTAGACAAQEAAVNDRSPGHSPPLAGARDGQVAVQEQFDAARKAGTVEAWDLFIRRYPDNPLTEQAKAERAALAEKP